MSKSSHSSGALHIFEQQDKQGNLVQIVVSQDLNGTNSIVASLDHPGAQEVRDFLLGQKKSGLKPDKIYIGLWSTLSPMLEDVWPQAQKLIEYNE